MKSFHATVLLWLHVREAGARPEADTSDKGHITRGRATRANTLNHLASRIKTLMGYSDEYIRKALSFKRVAMIGASLKTDRPSNRVFKYLRQHGYDIVPVNPAEQGKVLDGVVVKGALSEVSHPEFVDIFRKSEDVPPIVDDAIQAGAKVVWMQLGVKHEEAAKKALDAGLLVVMDRCPKIELERLKAAGKSNL